MEVIGLDRVEETVTHLVGKLIRKERESAGMSQDVLADRMRPLWPKISKAYISHIEAGKRRLSVAKLYIVALALDIEVSRILPDNLSVLKENPDK
jgi:transcriptional regulator with XRE-family HTH domain